MLPRPGAADLLKMAQQALQDQVLGKLDGEAKFAALMAVRAIAIAEVELRGGAPPPDWTTREVDLEEARVSLAIIRA